ncbi:hypothetical protein [Frankia sp. AgB32]|uniref:hypothetical protein n=1 Tax=Frankia sp. AgB32 TaxID=631119 RepID=UPI00200FB881|nr:hypothetical protein [Frankia sp. AgB32]MCK9894096.1 hypothetical protein [Frankia sp. AgB32]
MDETRFTVGELELVTDVSPADWIVAGVGSFDVTVGSLVPLGFPAYARVFHPACLDDAEVSWTTVAHGNDRVAHPSMEWISITGSWRYLQGTSDQAELWTTQPSQGSLPLPQAARLCDLLAEHTATTDRCWFAVWEGFGALAVPTEGTPKVAVPHRAMLLLTGPLAAATTSLERQPWDQRASLWWGSPCRRGWTRP